MVLGSLRVCKISSIWSHLNVELFPAAPSVVTTDQRKVRIKQLDMAASKGRCCFCYCPTLKVHHLQQTWPEWWSPRTAAQLYSINRLPPWCLQVNKVGIHMVRNKCEQLRWNFLQQFIAISKRKMLLNTCISYWTSWFLFIGWCQPLPNKPLTTG